MLFASILSWESNVKIWEPVNRSAVKEDIVDFITAVYAVKQTRDLMVQLALTEYNGGEKFAGLKLFTILE